MRLRKLALAVKKDYDKNMYYVKAFDLEENKIYKIFKRKHNYRTITNEVQAETSVARHLVNQGHWIEWIHINYDYPKPNPHKRSLKW